MTTLEAATSRMSWRTPGVIIICGCLMAVLSFGPRSALGFFLTPMSEDNGWGRDVFSLALAVQNLLWGAAQPFAGAIADRYGALRVLAGGAFMYVLGLALMAHSQSPAMLELSAGVLLGFGLSGCSFNVVLAAFPLSKADAACGRLDRAAINAPRMMMRMPISPRMCWPLFR